MSGCNYEDVVYTIYGFLHYTLKALEEYEDSGCDLKRLKMYELRDELESIAGKVISEMLKRGDD